MVCVQVRVSCRQFVTMHVLTCVHVHCVGRMHVMNVHVYMYMHSVYTVMYMCTLHTCINIAHKQVYPSDLLENFKKYTCSMCLMPKHLSCESVC